MASLKGCFLIAAPSLMDPNFFRSIVLILQHDEDGAVGLIVNRPTQATVADLWKQIGGSEGACAVTAPLHQGGPCEGPVMTVHTVEEVGQSEVIAANGNAPAVHFSSAEESIRWLVEHDAQPSKFMVGYAGWSAGQLEQELGTGSWLVLPATAGLVFSSDERLWSILLRQVTILTEYPHLDAALIPPDPEVN